MIRVLAVWLWHGPVWHMWHLLDQWQSYRKWFTHTVMISISGINWASYAVLLGLQLQNISHNFQLTTDLFVQYSLPLQNSHKIDMNIIIDFVVSMSNLINSFYSWCGVKTFNLSSELEPGILTIYIEILTTHFWGSKDSPGVNTALSLLSPEYLNCPSKRFRESVRLFRIKNILDFVKSNVIAFAWVWLVRQKNSKHLLI